MRLRHALPLSLLCLSLLCLGCAGAAPRGEAPSQAQWQAAKAANEAESRLQGYADSDSALRAKLWVLNQINADRQAHEAAPVALDILAGRVANRQAQEAAANEYSGHWNMAGELPWMRYSFAGGFAHVSENGGDMAWSGGGPDCSQLKEYGLQVHQSYMDEEPPNDGHLRNVVDPNHNFVGLGMACVGSHFSFYEEYLDRYLKVAQYPDTVQAGDEAPLIFKPRPGYHVAMVSVYYAPLPKPLSPAEISARYSYPDYTKKSAAFIYGSSLQEQEDGSVRCSFTTAEAGYYYVMAYVGHAQPAASGTFTTEGKIPASSIVIKAE